MIATARRTGSLLRGIWRLAEAEATATLPFASQAFGEAFATAAKSPSASHLEARSDSGFRVSSTATATATANPTRRSFASQSELVSAYEDDSVVALTLADDFMKCPDEKALWSVVLDNLWHINGGNLSRRDFNAAISQLKAFARNDLCTEDCAISRNVGLQTLQDYIGREVHTFNRLDIEDTLECFEDFPAKIRADLGHKIVDAYCNLSPDSKNIRRVMVASRNSLEERDPAHFDKLLLQLIDRPLTHRSRRDLANSLWAIRKDGLQYRMKRKTIERAIERFVEACDQFPSLGSQGGGGEAMAEGDADVRENTLKQYSQVWFAVTALKPPAAKRTGTILAEKLLEVMLRETEGCPDIDPSHWVVVVDALHKLNAVGHANQPFSASHSRLGGLLESVMDRFLSARDRVEARQVAVFLCASRYMQFVHKQRMDEFLGKLVEIFHANLASAGAKECGNVLGSLARLRVKRMDAALGQDILTSFLENLDQAKKRNITQCLVGVAKHGLRISSSDLERVMTQYFCDQSKANTWHLGGMMWSLQKINNARSVSFLHRFPILDQLLTEFVASATADPEVLCPIHISQALSAGPLFTARSGEQISEVVGKLHAMSAACNSQVIANSLSSLRKVKGLSLDAADKKKLSDLFAALSSKRKGGHQQPKVNEVAQAVSAAVELGLPLSGEVWTDALNQAVSAFSAADEDHRAWFGGKALSKIVFSVSKLENLSDLVDLGVRQGVVEAYGSLSVETQQRARGAKNARDDRFRILNHEKAFLREGEGDAAAAVV